MSITEAERHIGERVVYLPHPNATEEVGVIGSTSASYVFVQFGDDMYRKACYPTDLTLAVTR